MDAHVTTSEMLGGNSIITGKITCKMRRDLVDKLGLTSYFPQKITMADVHLKTTDKVKTLDDVPWCLLRNIIMLDYRGRNCMQFPENSESKGFNESKTESIDSVVTDIFMDILDLSAVSSINPVDVIVALYLCATDSLRQILSNKLFMCNLSIPILLPNIEDQTSTFLLWSLRSVIADFKQCDGTVIEETVASNPLSAVSFIRLGDTSRSKSKLINEIIGNHCHSTFFHRDCENGTSLQYLSRGMIDVTWFLPSEKLDTHFKKPVSFFNLHGDAREYENNLELMCKFSHLICLLVDIRELNDSSVLSILKSLSNSKMDLLFFISNKFGNIDVHEAKKVIIKSLKEAHIENIKHHNIILDFDNLGQKNWANIRNEAVFKINSCLMGKIGISLEKVTYQFEESFTNITIDENNSSCQKAKDLALQTLQYVKGIDLIGTKHAMLPLQGVLWNKWGKLEKIQHQKSYLEQGLRKMNELDINEQKHNIRTEQCEISKNPPIMMLIFLNTMLKADQSLRLYFFKWLEIYLDDICRNTFPKLHLEYINEWNEVQKYKTQEKTLKCENFSQLEEKLRQMERRLAESSLGIEHLMREVGQYYESTVVCGTETYKGLPELMAQMLLEGFPIELMDGDAMHVPISWITSVFTKLGELIGEKKIFILSVLGLQSSGKSTLLNTMFGLQFSVSAGRCTRGVFAQLVPMQETDSSFDYILVVDTEGLRAPELGLQKHQHDNELAAFVLGFGDVTIINMKGENPTEMQDILQICVHAFLRFKHTNKEFDIQPCCILSHQNVGSVIAKQKIMFSQQKLKENLDSMTQVAADQEGCRNISTFNQVISFDVENNVYYFSDLWQGDPPMAPVNPGYSIKVNEVKSDLIKIMKLKSSGLNTDFISKKFTHLWNNIMREDFVFSFRNTSELQAYTHLHKKFVKLSWNIESSIVNWASKTKQQIFRKEKGFDGFESNVIKNLLQLITELFNSTQRELSEYFESSDEKDVIEQWREKKMIELTYLKEEIIARTKKEFHDEIAIRKMQMKQTAKLKEFKNHLEYEARNMANLSHINLNKENEFEKLWSEWTKTTYGDISFKDHIDVKHEIRNLLYEVLQNEHHLLNSEYEQSKTFPVLLNLNKLPNIDKDDLVIKTKWLGLKNVQTFNECQMTAVYQTNVFFKLVEKYIEVNKITRVNKAHIGNIIKLVLEKITDYNISNATFKFSSKFKVKLLIWICHYLTNKFEKMQAKDKNTIDKRIDVMNHKNACFIHFSNTYKRICTENAAIDALIVSFHESLKNAVDKKILTVVVQDVLSHVPYLHSKAEIVKTILGELVENNSYEEYTPFFDNAEAFLQKRINNYTSVYLFQKMTGSKTNLNRIVEKEIQFQVNNMNQRVTHAQVKGKNNLQMWIKELCKGVESKILLPIQDLSPIFKYDIDICSFKKKILEKMTPIPRDLMKLYENMNANQFCSRYPGVYEEISKQCIGCPVQCPLCGCLCSLSNPNHDHKHQALTHLPLCVRGYLGDDDTLMVENCNSFVCGSTSLNDGTAKNTKYHKVYNDWHIPKDESVQSSMYWKWFVSNFRHQISKEYDAGNIDVPESWTIISKQSAVMSLNS